MFLFVLKIKREEKVGQVVRKIKRWKLESKQVGKKSLQLVHNKVLKIREKSKF